MAGKRQYSDEQVDDFLELAQEMGIGKAMKELGYPLGYQTALNWAENRGIKVEVDPVMKRVKQFEQMYKEEHMLEIARAGAALVYMSIVENGADLTADEQKKLSDAFQKYNNAWLLLKGKANDIRETQTKDGMDVELMNMLMAERESNAVKANEEVSAD
jgi:hypothetical protein